MFEHLSYYRHGLRSWAIANIYDSDIAAFGSGFLRRTAKAKCISELVERRYHLLRLEHQPSFHPLGIAAHVTPEKAAEAAWCEVIESHMVAETANEKAFHGIPLFRTKSFRMSVSRLNNLWFALCIGATTHGDVATYSASSSLIGAIFHAYEEWKVAAHFGILEKILVKFSKFNRYLKPQELSEIEYFFDRNLSRQVELGHLQLNSFFQKVTGATCNDGCRCEKCGRFIAVIENNEEAIDA